MRSMPRKGSIISFYTVLAQTEFMALYNCKETQKYRLEIVKENRNVVEQLANFCQNHSTENVYLLTMKSPVYLKLLNNSVYCQHAVSFLPGDAIQESK